MTPLKLVSLERPRLRPWPIDPPKAKPCTTLSFFFFQGEKRRRPITSGSLVVLLVRMPLPLKAPAHHWKTPPLTSPCKVKPGLRNAVAAAGYSSEASDRSTKSRLGAPVISSCAKGSLNWPICTCWGVDSGGILSRVVHLSDHFLYACTHQIRLRGCPKEQGL